MEYEIVDYGAVWDEFKSHYDDIEFVYFRFAYNGPINVFCCILPDDTILANSWDSIKNSVAAKFQSAIYDEFERWNFYLLFFVKKECTKEIKYKIENDKFSSRKIVFENYLEGEQGLIKKIENELFNMDIELFVQARNSFSTTILLTMLSSNIGKILTDKKNKLKPGAGAAKKNRRKAYEQLLKLYSYEI